jgi:hypothetical protein
MGVLYYLHLFAVKEFFMSRESNEYFWTVDVGMPLIVFQMGFLSIVTTIFLPIFFKAYGSVIFGSYGQRVRTGFDQ